MPFLWIVLILGHRRQRNFERIFFFLCLALLFYFGASLLELNAELYYTNVPPPLAAFSWTIVCLGLWFLPSLLLNLHTAYAGVRNLLVSRTSKKIWLVTIYLPSVLLLPYLYSAIRIKTGYDFVLPSNSLGLAFQICLLGALLISAGWQHRFAKSAPDAEQKSFHRHARNNLAAAGFYFFSVHYVSYRSPMDKASTWAFATMLVLFALDPLISLARNVEKFNFLQIGRQRNLMFAVFAAFVALLYLSFIRRVSLWMEPFFPPEATAAILLFLPVVFFEPLQRLVGRILRRTAQTEMDHAHRMMGPIQDVARLGNLEKLKTFIEKWIPEQLQLAEVALVLDGEEQAKAQVRGTEERFPIQQAMKPAGYLRVKPYGAMLSGETVAALEFICEQLPGALDLCRLIEEKVVLERELAERERLAVLGQMAASISHNLKNPLGSMKTILQVQLENPELPGSIRMETKMVLDEIGRLSTKLNQLLQFSRPAIRGGPVSATCDIRLVAEEVVSMMRHEAESRGVRLTAQIADGNSKIEAITEAVHDIIGNLVVNAIEAAPRGSEVKVKLSESKSEYMISVEDDGPGVPATLQEKVLQPFFTTKSQGTGLGLAIVQRRVTEMGGELKLISPFLAGKGTRFEVRLPHKSRIDFRKDEF